MKTKVKHKLGFTNDVVFATIMENPEICKELLQRILPDRKIRKLRLHEKKDTDYEKTIVEKSVEFDDIAKGVRLDVFFEDDENCYDIEMQCRHYPDILQRGRYYSSMLDMDQLKKGAKYEELKNTFVIFICTFDAFDMNEAVYFFEMFDRKNQLKLADGRYTIMVNTKCSRADLPPELKALFDYIEENEFDNQDAFISKIDKLIGEFNREDTDRRRKAMYLYDDLERRRKFDRAEARAEGLAEGREAGLAEGREAGLAEGREAGLAEGLAEGREAEKIEIARNMLRLGILHSTITEATGLSEEEIRKL